MKSAQIAVWFVLFTFTMDRAASQASDEADEYSDDRVHARLLALLQGCSEDVDCAGLWGNSAIDATRGKGPPPEMPRDMEHFFSYAGLVELARFEGPNGVLLDDRYAGASAMTPEWTREMIEEAAKKCGRGTLEGSYGLTQTRMVYEGLKRMASVKRGHVLVIGSEDPWLEACALEAGATRVTTLEYGAIRSLHPAVDTMLPVNAREAFTNGTLPIFDAVATFSSVEHSGLGRYGDALNPWADLQALARAWCVTRPGGELLLGVPTAARDRLEWNAHRKYGPVMYSHLTANWDQVARCGSSHTPDTL